METTDRKRGVNVWFKVNDVIDVRIWNSENGKTSVFLKRDELPPNEAGTVIVAPLRILSLYGLNYVVLVEKEFINESVAQKSRRIDFDLLDRYGINPRFEGCLFGVLPADCVIRKNDKKSYEVYQSLDLEEGATCRGPCKMHNKYAEPDGELGTTYLCRSCSLSC